MPVNGKNKGNSYERKIANLLSARFQVITGLPTSFRRNADSGSFFGGSNVKRTTTHDLNHANFGDIICPEKFKFSIECKNYKTAPTLNSLIRGSITQWDKWIKQATQDAVSSNKKMLLIIKYNGVDDIVFVDTIIPQLTTIFPYKDVFGYKLSDLLSLNDDYFFVI